jgi:hypothetical protein
MVIYVDADATFIQSEAGPVPVQSVVRHLRSLVAAGAELYCWSTAGAAHSEEIARAVGTADCFRAFLPKPQVVIDRQPVREWPVVDTHPNDCRFRTVADYQRELRG